MQKGSTVYEKLGNLPKYEYKKYEERKEYGNVVHGAQHDEKLPSQLRHEAHQLEDTEQAEGPQH